MKLCKLSRRPIIWFIGILLLLAFLAIISIHKTTLSGPAYSITDNRPCGELDLTFWELDLGFYNRVIKSNLSLPDIPGFDTEHFQVSGIHIHSSRSQTVFDIGLYVFNSQENRLQFFSLLYFPDDSVAYLSCSGQAIIAPAASGTDADAAIQAIGLTLNAPS